MEKIIYDENNGLWYELQGDYYIPCLKLPDEEEGEIGVWGMRHLNYLKQHRKATYNRLQAEFKLNSYLYDINSQAEEMFETLIKQFKLFKNKAILRVKNTTEDTMELIYEVSSSLLKKIEKDISITDGIYDLGGIEYVNIVMQNDEISN